ncbi:anthranilate synthase component I family protein [Microbacterium sp. 179-I 3D4 NHS]|uniref:anthranilate synthase component I family protein n=1 Tax=Microbacterium sp. 179-I 3D4 NHS TaxID=3142381 RepID=UPI0039A1999E
MPHRLSARPLGSWTDPDGIFTRIESEAPAVFWLDAGPGAVDGWSYIGLGHPDSLPTGVRIDRPRGDADLPPFRGGWVGWHDYESGADAAGAPTASPDAAAGPRWIRTTRMVAFDHTARRCWALAAADELDDWTEFLQVAADAASAPIPDPPREAIADARHEPAAYATLIEQCRELIRSGIAYQLCLTTRFTVPGAHDPVSTYRRLRHATPAHHGGFVRIGGRSLLSASPEQFLHVQDGTIRTRPIKGTRPRAADPLHDAALAAELRDDAKERAENVMIVDLMRNDLSRVCEPGSIRVQGLWVVESYPAVHQLVSTVSGRAAEGTIVGDLLRAAFPAGSMTGAPKLSAMTRLHALEGGPRGIYAGCFGYIGSDGAVDLAMVIRSIVVERERAYVGAGGGITWGSRPDAEVAEVATKARAPLAALGAVLPGRWASDILN